MHGVRALAASMKAADARVQEGLLTGPGRLQHSPESSMLAPAACSRLDACRLAICQTLLHAFLEALRGGAAVQGPPSAGQHRTAQVGQCAGGGPAADPAKAGKLLTEVAAVLEEADLTGVQVVAADEAFLAEANRQIHSQAQARAAGKLPGVLHVWQHWGVSMGLSKGQGWCVAGWESAGYRTACTMSSSRSQ